MANGLAVGRLFGQIRREECLEERRAIVRKCVGDERKQLKASTPPSKSHPQSHTCRHAATHKWHSGMKSPTPAAVRTTGGENSVDPRLEKYKKLAKSKKRQSTAVCWWPCTTGRGSVHVLNCQFASRSQIKQRFPNSFAISMTTAHTCPGGMGRKAGEALEQAFCVIGEYIDSKISASQKT